MFCKDQNNIDQLFVVSNYKEPLIEKSIKYFKYRFISDMHVSLSTIAGRYIEKLIKIKRVNVFEDNPLLISVPLETRRLNWRGFNQSALIAKYLADRFLLEYLENGLERKKSARPQASIKDRSERVANLGCAFECKAMSRIQGRIIILVDDICTTGSTLNSCASALKRSGAKKVIGFVIARG
jgi:ComF family protein